MLSEGSHQVAERVNLGRLLQRFVSERNFEESLTVFVPKSSERLLDLTLDTAQDTRSTSTLTV